MFSSSSVRPTEDRRGQILQEVLRSQFVTVASLARQFDLSQVSIRRNGVSPERGLTTDNVLEAGLYRQVACLADRVVVVTDSGKIGLDKLQTILPFEDLHTFIRSRT